MNLSGIEKAAILLLLMDEEIAAEVLRTLEIEEIKEISESMSKMGKD